MTGGTTIRSRVAARARRYFGARGAQGRIRARRLAGVEDEHAIPVIMCMWVRPHRIDAAMRLLEQQEGASIRFIVWNNKRGTRRFIREQLTRRGARGSVASIELVSSPVNLGGMGRFYAIKRLVGERRDGPVIMLDDDQDIGPTFVSDLITSWEPRSVRGVWAFVQHSGYWDRRPAHPGEEADYVGTGGCIVDRSVVELPGFFDELPEKYYFLEDMWMSDRARRAGWSLQASDTPYEFVEHDTNQYLGFGQLKEEFQAYLSSLA